MVDRRSFINWGSSAIGNQLIGQRLGLLAFRGRAAQQGGDKQPTAADWMSQWMLSPTLGQRKLRGPGQGMLVVGRFADPMYILEDPISWTPDQDQKGFPTFTVPKGFVTDLASIPPIFWSVLRPDGEYAYAAILHDYLYWVQKWPKTQADSILKRCMQDFSVPTVKVDAIYDAVDLFGKSAWENNAKLKAQGDSRFLRAYPSDPTVRWSTWKQNSSHFDPNPTG
jgi:hypothetical protein